MIKKEKTNSEKIRDQFIAEGLLRGCVIGCIASAVVLLMGVTSNSWYYIKDLISWLALIVVIASVIGSLIASISQYRKITYAVRIEELTWGGDFDAEPLSELADSGTFYTASEFLVWHREQQYQVFHKRNISRIDNVGRRQIPGNHLAMVRITSRKGVESVLPYEISADVNFLRELINWVNPDALKPKQPEEAPREEQPKADPVCPSCGAVNHTGAVFCAYCGTRLNPTDPTEDAHGESLNDLGYEPLGQKQEAPASNPVTGTTVPHRGTSPAYARSNARDRDRQHRSFWIVLAAIIIILMILMTVLSRSTHHYYWGNELGNGKFY